MVTWIKSILINHILPIKGFSENAVRKSHSQIIQYKELTFNADKVSSFNKKVYNIYGKKKRLL